MVSLCIYIINSTIKIFNKTEKKFNTNRISISLINILITIKM